MKYRFLLVVALNIGLASHTTLAATFFSEDFESYAMDGEVSSIGGWTISNTASTVETEAQWRLADTKATASVFGLPPTVNFGPATLGGATTPLYDPTGTGDPGLFMIAVAGGVPPGLFDTFPSGSTPPDPELAGGEAYNSRLSNATYSGASNDIITPSFSTVGASGDVWLHTSVSAQLGNNDESIFDVDYSTDGGANWTNVFRRISPGTSRDFAKGDFDEDLDVDGIDFLTQQRLINFADCPNCGPDGGASENAHDFDKFRRDTEQRFTDWEKAFQGKYTPIVATVADGNAGGHHGELDLNLGAIGGNSDVKVRFRHMEDRDSEFMAIDNVVVNDTAPAGSASQTIFTEDFITLDLGQMDVYTYTYFGGFFGVDTGGGSGTLSGHSWGAQDRPSPGRPNGRYEVNVVGDKGVNHLGHPTAEGVMGQVPFAIIDSASEEDGVDPDGDNTQIERLHTPLLDLSSYSSVILEWDDETVFDGEPILAKDVASVVLMQAIGSSPANGDTIIAEPNKAGIDFAVPYLPYDQFGGGAFSGGDDPIFMHHRLDITSLVNMATDETKLYVAFQYKGSDNEYWAVDNILITGELALLSAVATPEPASWILALFGIPAYATVRRRRCVRYRL